MSYKKNSQFETVYQQALEQIERDNPAQRPQILINLKSSTQLIHGDISKVNQLKQKKRRSSLISISKPKTSRKTAKVKLAITRKTQLIDKHIQMKGVKTQSYSTLPIISQLSQQQTIKHDKRRKQYTVSHFKSGSALSDKNGYTTRKNIPNILRHNPQSLKGWESVNEHDQQGLLFDVYTLKW